jgi:hypothetical protein
MQEFLIFTDKYWRDDDNPMTLIGINRKMNNKSRISYRKHAYGK